MILVGFKIGDEVYHVDSQTKRKRIKYQVVGITTGGIRVRSFNTGKDYTYPPDDLEVASQPQAIPVTPPWPFGGIYTPTPVPVKKKLTPNTPDEDSVAGRPIADTPIQKRWQPPQSTDSPPPEPQPKTPLPPTKDSQIFKHLLSR